VSQLREEQDCIAVGAECVLQNFFRSHAVQGMAMSYLYLVRRILFALIFSTPAPRHFTREGIQHAADLGVPFAALLVPVSGLSEELTANRADRIKLSSGAGKVGTYPHL
jgi:hypothetical protein